MTASNRIGMLVRLDRCIGCQACQIACQECNQLPAKETWLDAVRRKPKMVDGKLRMYHVLNPELDKCSTCIEKHGDPLCADVCSLNCLYVGQEADLLEKMQGNGFWSLMVR